VRRGVLRARADDQSDGSDVGSTRFMSPEEYQLGSMIDG
jgi:hypothetical protein